MIKFKDRKSLAPTPKSQHGLGVWGFTLIEVMTALSIFIIAITLSMGAILGVFDANRKSRAIKTVMSNLNLAVETMSREIRFGQNYHCGSQGNITTPRNCPSGDDFISFLSSEGDQFVYRLNGTAVESSNDGGSTYIPLTAPELTIEAMEIYVVGAGTAPDNNLQPKVVLRISGRAGSSQDTASTFALQTLISQRYLDTP